MSHSKTNQPQNAESDKTNEPRNRRPGRRKQPIADEPTFQDTFIREARVNYLHSEHPMFQITGASDVAKFVRSILTDNSREHLVALYLDSQNQVTAYSIVSIGSANYAPVAPREVFQRAVLIGAISIIVAHNHPSGSPTPSDNDRSVTRRLYESGQVLGIPILDHVIVTDRTHCSLKDEGGLGDNLL